MPENNVAKTQNIDWIKSELSTYREILTLYPHVASSDITTTYIKKMKLLLSNVDLDNEKECSETLFFLRLTILENIAKVIPLFSEEPAITQQLEESYQALQTYFEITMTSKTLHHFKMGLSRIKGEIKHMDSIHKQYFKNQIKKRYETESLGRFAHQNAIDVLLKESRFNNVEYNNAIKYINMDTGLPALLNDKKHTHTLFSPLSANNPAENKPQPTSCIPLTLQQKTLP